MNHALTSFTPFAALIGGALIGLAAGADRSYRRWQRHRGAAVAAF